jgi:uncharacterized membrane protein YfcA
VIDSPTSFAIVVIAGFIAGAINGVVGSGTLFTFSALLAVGVPPVAANGTNTTGLFPGSFASSYAYRSELRSRLKSLRWPIVATAIGACVGALLVVSLPEEVFATVVPWLIASATVMVAIGPLRTRITSRLAARRRETADESANATAPLGIQPARQRALWPWTGAVGIYGGYFGAAQGVVLMAVLTWIYDTRVQYSNAAKNLFASIANMMAAFVFILAGYVVWPAALLLMVSSMLGGYLGARWARRLPEVVLRGMVIAVGVIATTVLVVG